MNIHLNSCCCFLLATIEIISATLTNLNDVTYYEFVHVRHVDEHGRNRRDLSTYDGDKHLEQTSYVFNGHGRHFHLQLYKNEMLFHPSFSTIYQHSDGTSRRHNSTNHCYYHGHVTGRNRSSVAVNTCYGFSGVVTDDDDEEFIIQPYPPSTNRKDLPKSYILFKTSAVVNNDGMSECGVDHNHSIFQNPVMLGDMRYKDRKTNNYKPGEKSGFDFYTVIDDAGSNNARIRRSTKADDYTKYIETVVVLDKLFLKEFNENAERAQKRALEIFNIVDSKFKTVKTRVAVVNIVLWNVFNMARVSRSNQETLHYFARYTRDVLRYEMGLRFDNAQLLTTQSWGSIVGYAGIGVLCSPASSAINRDHVSRPAVGTACIVTHEMGHNIGLRHNTDTCTCDTPPCVMNSMSAGNCKGFTDCSKSEYSARFQQDHLPCMLDSPHSLYGQGWCGNGWVEEGEACDCGTAEECESLGAQKCCNSTTCQLHTHAHCATGPCCDGCQFKNRGVLCRDKMNTDCDLPEYCTGTSSNCPQNFYVMDGTPCGDDSGYCYDGSCNTHSKQCQSSKKNFRISSDQTANKASDSCYRSRNMAGNNFGNCGKDMRGDFVPCRAEDALCGKLQCDFGSRKCVWLQSQGSQEEQDPTMTYAGLKCGPERLCVDQQCVNISSLSHIKTCSKTCANAGGVCNNNGNCHCPEGRACPYCELAGPGGSADSGQGCILHDSCEDCFTPLAKAMLVLFLLIIPLAVLAVFVYRNRTVIWERIRNRQFSVPTWSSRGADHDVVTNKDAGNVTHVLSHVAGQPSGSNRPPLPPRPSHGPPPSRPPRPPASIHS